MNSQTEREGKITERPEKRNYSLKRNIIITFLILIFIFPVLCYFYLKIKIFNLNLLEVGQKASHFKLYAADGAIFNLSDHKGKKIILVFFKTDCSSCLRQLATLIEIKKSATHNLEIIAISESDPDKTREFAKFYNINFPILIDDQKVLKNRYKGRALPTLYLLDEDMRVRYARTGYRSLYFDRKLISEFELTNRLPIEAISESQKEELNYDGGAPSISCLAAKQIAYKLPEVKAFLNESNTLLEERREVIFLAWDTKEHVYKWIVQIVKRKDDQGNKGQILDVVAVEINAQSGKIFNQELLRKIPEQLFKEMFYQKVIGRPLLYKAPE